MSDEFFSISEVNHFIKDVIDAGFPQTMWVCGEIQGYNRNKHKNHIYFELVEKDPTSKSIKAKINAVIFANSKFHIFNVLKQSDNAFELKDDIEVKFSCKVNFYEPYGTLSLIIDDIDPTYTLGKMAQEKQRLIAKLKKKGTLDKNKQVELPTVPLNIGLITADDSAAYNDFISEIEKSKFGFKIQLRNALMQGNAAEKDIAKAIDELNRNKALDVIVVTRGGGSIADLSCFDSEQIAEKIASSRLPVLSGIGHEINFSITDMAAHTFAKTPTAIAQFIVHRVGEFMDSINSSAERLFVAVEERMEGEQQGLKDKALVLQNQTTQYLKKHNENIIRIRESLRNRPVMLLKEFNRLLMTNRDNILKGIKLRFDTDNRRLKNFQKIIDVVHPRNTLKRGFSITRTKTGQVLRHVSEAKPEDELVTELGDGQVHSIVKS